MQYEIIDLKDPSNAEKKDYSTNLIFFSDEWENKNKQILGFLSSKKGEGIKLNARSCEVKEISKIEAKSFLDKNHIQGSNNLSLIFFGLYNKLELIAVLSLGRHNRNISLNRIVLDRFCVKSGINVRGGASKLFKQAINWAKERKYDEIISFSDNRISEGKIYKILGFYLEKEYKSDYFYVDVKTGKKLSKQSQKKSTSKCPKELTEFEWATKRGLLRFWDKGKKRWVFSLNDSFASWTERLSEKCANQNKNGDFKHSHIRGYFESKKNNKKIYYGSSYELRCIFLLEDDEKVLCYERAECFKDSKGKFRNPDLLVTYLNGSKFLFEIKPKSRLEESDVIEQINESKMYSEKNKITFKLWTEDDSGFFGSSEIIKWAKSFLLQKGDSKWIKSSRDSANKRSKKYYQKHIANNKVEIYCEYCKEKHTSLSLTYNKNINRNGRYICEKEGGHISGSKPKPHLRKINPYESEGKKECNNCHSILLLDCFSVGKSICKKCRAAKYKEKYNDKKHSTI
jgi:hypothetical protein